MKRLLPKSIRRRTLLIVLLLLMGMSSLIGVASFNDASHEIEEIFDARLAQNARILQALVIGIHESELSESDEESLQRAFEEALLIESNNRHGGHKYESKIAYQVWHGTQLIMRSANSPETPISVEKAGFSTIHHRGYEWVTFTLRTHSTSYPFVVSVAEREDVRGELVEKIVLQTLVPELIGIPLLGFLLWGAIGWGLHPLKELANRITARAPNNLSPIQLSETPKELEPILSALNSLLGATETLLAREQRLIADAAHELRTPLAVLKIHADNALNAESDMDKQQALEQLSLGVDRSTRLVSQLLTLARLDPELQQAPRHETHLLNAVRQQLAELMPIAWKKQIELSLEADEAGQWTCSLEEGTLDILLQNLISNAVKFSPESATIEVHLTDENQHYCLSVVDHGAGVPEASLARLTERFFREGNGCGAGLGLSIVKRIAERHGGSLKIMPTAGGGLTVSVYLPH